VTSSTMQGLRAIPIARHPRRATIQLCSQANVSVARSQPHCGPSPWTVDQHRAHRDTAD